MKAKAVHFFFFLTTVFSLWSCKATRNLNENQTLLVKNTIEYVDKENHKHISEDDITAVLRQKPNRKILGIWRFHLQAYNIVSSEKIEQKNAKKRRRIEKKNERRRNRGKDTVEFQPHWLDWLRNTVGEPPVILDTNKTSESTQQVEKFLFNNGFFNNSVSYSLQYRYKWSYRLKSIFNDSISPEIERKNRLKKAEVVYNITTGSLYKINDVQFSLEDVNTLKAIKKAVRNSALGKGAPYQVETIEEERERVTNEMRNQGYFDFQKEYIYYRVDSTLQKNRVNIQQVITSPKRQEMTEQNKDTTIAENHRKYRIRNVYVNSNYKANSSFVGSDTLYTNNIYFLNRELMQYKATLLADNIFIQAGDIYSEERELYTYNRLAGLKNFKFINIDFEKIEGLGSDTLGYLDCTIRLTPSAQQSVGIEAEGTHRSSNLGVSGSLTYANKNTFKGAERFEVRVHGGLEAQQISNVSEGEDDANQTVSAALPFNTIEYGGELSLYIPELLIPFRSISPIQLPKYNEPRTNFNLTYNFQQRPDFTRTILNSSFSYLFSLTGKNTNNITIYPVDVAFIGIEKSTAFENLLNSLSNSVLSASYTNQLITSTKFSHEWSNQRDSKSSKNKNFTAVFSNFEIAGNALQTIYNATNEPRNKNGNYELFGNPFAQFVKVDSELRIHNQLTKNSKIVYRAFAGVGVPYGNSEALPFVKSFFGGGANDIRAWQARTLGPGALPDSLGSGIDHIGDILLEANIEYRYPLIDFLEGAAFIDAGNIWLLEKQEQRPNGHFELDQFYKQIAVGAGLGLRLDFTFLIVRIDAGIPIHDPSLPETERWIFQSKDQYKAAYKKSYTPKVNFNLGIGYPF